MKQASLLHYYFCPILHFNACFEVFTTEQKNICEMIPCLGRQMLIVQANSEIKSEMGMTEIYTFYKCSSQSCTVYMYVIHHIDLYFRGAILLTVKIVAWIPHLLYVHMVHALEWKIFKLPLCTAIYCKYAANEFRSSIYVLVWVGCILLLLLCTNCIHCM